MSSVEGRIAVAEFDAELAAAKGKLNPGTTADLVAAGIYVITLYNGLVSRRLAVREGEQVARPGWWARVRRWWGRKRK